MESTDEKHGHACNEYCIWWFLCHGNTLYFRMSEKVNVYLTVKRQHNRCEAFLSCWPEILQQMMVKKKRCTRLSISVKPYILKSSVSYEYHLLELSFLDKFSKKSSNIKSHQNTSSGSRVIPCGRTDGGTDMTKLVVDFLNIANAPKSSPFSHTVNCYVSMIPALNNYYFSNIINRLIGQGLLSRWGRNWFVIYNWALLFKGHQIVFHKLRTQIFKTKTKLRCFPTSLSSF
jgi:hypothetical protein